MKGLLPVLWVSLIFAGSFAASQAVWLLRARRIRRGIERTRREARVRGLLGLSKRKGGIDAALVLQLGLWMAVLGTLLVLGGIGAMGCAVLADAACRGNRKISGSKIGRAECPPNSGVGKGGSGQNLSGQDFTQAGASVPPARKF